MSDSQKRTRPLKTNERALVRAVLALEAFDGRAELDGQLDSVVAVHGDSDLQLDLAVPAGHARSRFTNGPIPTRTLVVDDEGDPVGEVIVWVKDGYLSGLEYAWFTDEKPVALPDPAYLSRADG